MQENSLDRLAISIDLHPITGSSMDPLTAKLATQSLTPEAKSAAEAKTRPSKFDKVRAELASAQQDPAAMASNPPSSAQSLASVARSQAVAAGAPTQHLTSLSADALRVSRARVNELQNRVAALGQSPALDAIRNRLSRIDAEYQRVGRSVDLSMSSASPQQLLKLQKDMNDLSENLNIVSKLVDEATGGIKSILQTQV
jgi:hypothetical protein